MIVFDLHCKQGHRFEGWFGSAKDFTSQKKRDLLSCPTCGDSSIERGLSAPRLNMGAVAPKQPAQAPDARLDRAPVGDLEHRAVRPLLAEDVPKPGRLSRER